MLLPYLLETWLWSWGGDSVWVKVQVFEISALYLNILLECYQVVFGHYLGPRIILLVQNLSRCVTWDFGSKF